MNNTMLVNGLKYIISSAEQLIYIESLEETIDASNLIRESVLSLYTGIELVFRSRLYNENWTYVFSDMNQADKGALEIGNYEPVSFSNSLERLVNLCNIRISEEDKKSFMNLIRRMNTLSFYDDVPSLYSIEAVMYHAIGSSIGFVTLESVSKEVKSLIKDLKKWLEALTNFHKIAQMSASTSADGACFEENRVECPSCGEVFLVPDNAKSGKCYCYYCGYEANGESAARAYISNVKGLNERKILKDGGFSPISICPTCNKKALIEIDDKSECLACRRVFEDGIKQKKVIPNQAEGIMAAKARGVKFGRPRNKLPKNFDEVYQQYKNKKITGNEAAEKLNMSPSTFWYKIKNYEREDQS